MNQKLVRAASIAAMLLIALFCSFQSVIAQEGAITVVAVGDIGECDSSGDEAVAQLVSGVSGRQLLLTLGDTVYPSGTVEQFRDCYDPAWGQFKQITRPAIGNHEYLVDDMASPYDAYFADQDGGPSFYYSFQPAPGWLGVVLNPNCGKAGGCSAASPQGKWLKSTLDANTAKCILVMAHQPRYNSGQYGEFRQYDDLVEMLYAHGADVFLSGHAHHYERFARQNPFGNYDPSGFVQLVVGTGGSDHGAPGPYVPIANSITFNRDTFGILKLDLSATGYHGTFIPEPGKTFTDDFVGGCDGSSSLYLPAIRK